MEKIGVGMAFSDLGQTRVYPSLSDTSAERYPMGFTELLGAHHQDSSRYAFIHMPPLQLPATPNTSSISLASCGAVTGEDKKRDYQENEYQEEHHKSNNKRLKSTKISEQTRIRVPKVSFITKSHVNNLDDGYKWRKYGQKPVRNSPFPRSYYRCTTSWCNVKKRVERSFSDPSSVITTYEGQHTHPRPLIISKNGSFGSYGSASRAHFDLIPTLPPQLFDYNNQQQQQQELSLFGTQYLNRQEKGSDHDDEDDDHVIKTRRTQDLLDGAGLVKDQGLLQDVVPAHIIKEEY